MGWGRQPRPPASPLSPAGRLTVSARSCAEIQPEPLSTSVLPVPTPEGVLVSRAVGASSAAAAACHGGCLGMAATEMAVQWIQGVQEMLGTLLPADSVAYSSQQADAHCPLLPPSTPTLSPAATDSASQAATASRHDNHTTAAEGASADQQQGSNGPVKQAGNEPQPSAKGDTVYCVALRSRIPPLVGLGMRLERWQHRSEAPDCGCDSCLAWQTGHTAAQTQAGHGLQTLPLISCASLQHVSLLPELCE